MNVTKLSSYADLGTAVSEIGATECTLYIDKDDVMTANVTVPITMQLHFLKGNLITTTGYTLTISGGPENIVAQPNQQIFAGTGTVSFTKPGKVYPNWCTQNTSPGTTDMSSALQAAITATGIVEFLAETYLSDQSTFSSDVWLMGQGPASIVKIKALTNDYLFSRSGTSATNNFKAQNFAIDGNKANNAGAEELWL